MVVCVKALIFASTRIQLLNFIFHITLALQEEKLMDRCEWTIAEKRYAHNLGSVQLSACVRVMFGYAAIKTSYAHKSDFGVFELN